MTINELRTKYFDYFKSRGHEIIPSAPIVPLNDPTTLFTGSGMQPMIPYLLGTPHALGMRIANSQKSFRADDIEEVGDNRHTTFFEMLGNWSLGDYFKKEQIPWMFDFLINEAGIDPQNLYITAFNGDERYGMPRDTESVDIWKELFATKGIDADDAVMGSEGDAALRGMRGARIFYYDAKKNWWSRAGTPDKMPPGEPGGPDTEMFYDFGTTHDAKFGEHCHPNCDCGRFMEFGNNVFMQYIKKEDGTFGLLPKQNVDFGGGLERILAAANNIPDVFLTDVFADIIALLEEFSGKHYNDSRYQKSFRIIADHLRAAVFMLSDGVRPSNTDRGYVLRRLLRRASQHALKIGTPGDQHDESILNRCAVIVIEKYRQAYPELGTEESHRMITDEVWKEEKQFGHALENGMREFEKSVLGGSITGEQAFVLFTTFGFPLEMTLELAQERGISVDVDDYKRRMKAHQELSRVGGEQKFKGGLADASAETTRLHTAHHLLLRALQQILGPEVKQRGSNITAERLRIDFSYGAKLTPEQKAEAERIVNEKIGEALPVLRSTMPIVEADKLNAQHEFGAKYPDVVSVYSMGPVAATLDNPQFDKAFSIEFCGGPHVENTSELSKSGTFKIIAEESVAAGIRRIKAVLK